MITWMAYAALVGGIVAVGGLAMERLADAMGQPRRIAWLVALTLGIVIPLTGGWGSRAAAPVVAESGTSESAVISGASIEGFWSAMPALPVPDGMATGRIALLAWAAGSLASLAVLAGVLMLVARGRRRWERRRVHGAEVYVSRRFGPALVGVARPEVVIPSWALQLEPGALDAIIRHEAEHARARDHLVLLFGGLAIAAFPWSPAIWWMYRRLRAAVELDCDQRVLASGIGVADYGEVLLNAGSRCRGRWAFAPAMGQPESLLERRLKTMSETRKGLSGGYAALLVAVAVGALVVACDTPVPTEVLEAFEEVMAEEAAQGADAEQEDLVVRFLQAAGTSRRAIPLLFVDGVRIQTTEDLPLTAGDPSEFPLAPEDIVRIEVLKGPAARELYGDEAAGGVIQVFTEGAELEVVVVPPGERIVVTGQATATEPEAKFIDMPAFREIVVTGQAKVTGAEAKFIDMPAVREMVVTGQARMMERPSDWDRWLAENTIANAPPGAKPVIYVDGVRVDGGAALIAFHPALASDRIDRIEVIKGEAAREKYGKEGANGVIQIFTKKESSGEPVPEAEKDDGPSAKRSSRLP